MPNPARLISFLLLLMLSRGAGACILVPNQTIDEVFRASPIVVLAEVESGSRTVGSSNPEAAGPIETVNFRVLVSWKGPYRPGSTLTTVTNLYPSLCGMSVDPDARVFVDAPAKRLGAGGIWVLFLGNDTPLVLFYADPGSRRLGAGGEAYLDLLFQLSRLANP